jgi:hypothetical protein
MITVLCGECRGQLAVPDTSAGKDVDCPHCGRSVPPVLVGSQENIVRRVLGWSLLPLLIIGLVGLGRRIVQGDLNGKWDWFEAVMCVDLMALATVGFILRVWNHIEESKSQPKPKEKSEG